MDKFPGGIKIPEGVKMRCSMTESDIEDVEKGCELNINTKNKVYIGRLVDVISGSKGKTRHVFQCDESSGVQLEFIHSSYIMAHLMFSTDLVKDVYPKNWESAYIVTRNILSLMYESNKYFDVIFTKGGDAMNYALTKETKQSIYSIKDHPDVKKWLSCLTMVKIIPIGTTSYIRGQTLGKNHVEPRFDELQSHLAYLPNDVEPRFNELQSHLAYPPNDVEPIAFTQVPTFTPTPTSAAPNTQLTFASEPEIFHQEYQHQHEYQYQSPHVQMPQIPPRSTGPILLPMPLGFAPNHMLHDYTNVQYLQPQTDFVPNVRLTTSNSVYLDRSRSYIPERDHPYR
jgi:hypothetical protein